jgi:hypothetical protein
MSSGLRTSARLDFMRAIESSGLSGGEAIARDWCEREEEKGEVPLRICIVCFGVTEFE